MDSAMSLGRRLSLTEIPNAHMMAPSRRMSWRFMHYSFAAKLFQLVLQSEMDTECVSGE